MDAKNRTVVGHLRWRSQFAPEPARRFTGFHRVNKFDYTLMNMIARRALECSNVKARGAISDACQHSSCLAFRARRSQDRHHDVSPYQAGAHSQSPVKAYKRGGDAISMRLGFWRSVVNKAHIPKYKVLMELAIKSCFGQDAGKRAKTTGSFGTQRPRGARLCDGADWARVDGGRIKGTQPGWRWCFSSGKTPGGLSCIVLISTATHLT